MKEKPDNQENVIDIKEGQRQAKRKRRTSRYVFAFCVILFAVLVFVFRDKIEIRKWLNSVDTFFGKSVSAQNIELSYDSASSASADYYQEFIAILGNKDLTFYNSEAKAEYKQSINMNNPVLRCYDKYVLAYDCGGNELYVTNSYKVIHSEKFDNAIISARLSKDNHMVVITKMKNYKAAVTVYSSSYKELYRVLCSSEYVSDADVSNDGKSLAVAVYEGEYGTIKSAVKIYDMKSENCKSVIDNIDGLILSVDYKAAGRIHIITQSGYYVSTDGQTAEPVLDFGNMYLDYFDITGDKSAVIVLDGRMLGKGTELYMFNAYGAQTGYLTFDSDINCFDKTDDFVFVGLLNSLEVYNYDGEQTDTMDIAESTEKIIASNEGKLVVFEAGNVYIIN